MELTLGLFMMGYILWQLIPLQILTWFYIGGYSQLPNRSL